MNQCVDKNPWGTREYWDGRFRAGDTPWELGAPSGVLFEACAELERLGVSLHGARVLQPGCGTGSDALELASRGASVVGVEWSQKVAEDLLKKSNGLSSVSEGRFQVRVGDFFELIPEQVDIACEHTFLCALDPELREKYVQQIAAWVKPDGYLCGNFFIVSDEDAHRLPGLSLARDGAGPPFAITTTRLLSLLKGYFSPVVLRPGSNAGAGRRPGLEWVGVFRRCFPS